MRRPVQRSMPAPQRKLAATARLLVVRRAAAGSLGLLARGVARTVDPPSASLRPRASSNSGHTPAQIVHRPAPGPGRGGGWPLWCDQEAKTALCGVKIAVGRKGSNCEELKYDFGHDTPTLKKKTLNT